MKISGVHLSRVRVPLRLAFVSANGVRSYYQKTIVRLGTKDGITGYGETDGSDEVFSRVCQIAKNITDHEQSVDSGQTSAELFADFRHAPLPDRVAVGGIEIACWDIEGKRHGQPVCQLLGGAHRSSTTMVCELSAGPFAGDEDPSTIEAFFADPGNADHVVQAGVEEVKRGGYRALKQKCTGRSVDWDIRVMQGFRAALGPDFKLRHDPNGAYSLAEAVALCEGMDDLNLQWFEDPTTGIDNMRSVRSKVQTPLATNMCVTDFDQLDHAIRQNALDVVGIDPFHWAGLANAQDAISMCKENGLNVFCHHFLDLGISTAAMLHLSSSIPDLRSGMDTSIYLQGTDIIREGEFKVKNGVIDVPMRPGLGVIVDELAVKQYLVDEYMYGSQVAEV